MSNNCWAGGERLSHQQHCLVVKKSDRSVFMSQCLCRLSSSGNILYLVCISCFFIFFLRYLCSRNLVQIYAMSIMSSLEDGLDELLSWGPLLQHFKTFFVGLSGSSNNLISLETEWLIQDYRNLLEEKNKSLNNCRALHWIFLHLACPHDVPCLVMTSACIPVVNCAWWWPVNASSWTSPCIPMVNHPWRWPKNTSS